MEPTGNAAVDIAGHTIRADLMEMEDLQGLRPRGAAGRVHPPRPISWRWRDRLIERMDERLDAVDADLKAIRAHLGVPDDA